MREKVTHKHLRWTSVCVGVVAFALGLNRSYAAEFALMQNNSQPGVPILYISGQIKQGDTDKLIELLRSDLESAPRITDVWLNSPGGDLSEAIRTGGLLEKLGYTAVVPTGATCASACFFVWVSAPARLAPGTLIIHRPYFNMRDSSVPASGFEERYRITSENVYQYLRQRNVPANLIDRMMKVSSADGYTLTDDDKLSIGFMSPARTEYMVQNCGLPDASEAKRIDERGGLSPREIQTLRECGLRFYQLQKREFFFGNLDVSPEKRR
jgi:hypothetical protein